MPRWSFTIYIPSFGSLMMLRSPSTVTCRLHVFDINFHIFVQFAPFHLELFDQDSVFVGAVLDVEQWETSLQQAADSLNDKEMGRLLLEAYKGDYLQADGYLWAEYERERLRIKWLQHTMELGARLEETGHPGEAARVYKAIQEKHPLWEASYHVLMRCYDQLGHAGEVIHQYDKLKAILEKETGFVPDREITEWFERWSAARSAL